jgi:hypothetical protein
MMVSSLERVLWPGKPGPSLPPDVLSVLQSGFGDEDSRYPWLTNAFAEDHRTGSYHDT